MILAGAEAVQASPARNRNRLPLAMRVLIAASKSPVASVIFCAASTSAGQPVKFPVLEKQNVFGLANTVFGSVTVMLVVAVAVAPLTSTTVSVTV